MIEMRPGSHQWETNFVADITNFELKSWAARGKGSSSLRWVLSDSTMGCHTSQIVPGTYKKAHRHTCGTNVFTIDGEGYSMLWYEGKEDELTYIFDNSDATVVFFDVEFIACPECRVIDHVRKRNKPETILQRGN